MPSSMTMDQNNHGTNNHTMDRHEEEPIIDFELEREMVDLDKTKAKKKKDARKPKEAAAASNTVIKTNLNESSDFDLDNYWI